MSAFPINWLWTLLVFVIIVVIIILVLKFLLAVLLLGGILPYDHIIENTRIVAESSGLSY